MNRKFRFRITGFFLLATLISAGLYFSSGKKTYSDQTIRQLSDQLQANVLQFLKNNQAAIDSMSNDISRLTSARLTPDYLNRYALKRLQQHPEMHGVIIFGKRFHFLFARDKESYVATYDTNFNDTLTNWVRLDNQLHVQGRWTDTYNYFIDEISLKKTQSLLKKSGKESLWKVFRHKNPGQKDFILSTNLARLRDGNLLSFAFVYDLHRQQISFLPKMKILRPIVSFVTPLEKFTFPFYPEEKQNDSVNRSLVSQISRLLDEWEKSSGGENKSYLFLKNGERYWMHVALIPHSYGMRAVAYATSEDALKKVEHFQSDMYGYAALVFGILALLGIFSLRKKQNSVPALARPNEEDARTIISRGENEKTEFKSSLRWDYREQKVNPALETVILKGIAAFANGQGGLLLIGVDDTGKILGLKPDFNTLKKKEADGFELHLRRLIKNQFGISFSTSQVQIAFPVVEGKTICIVTVAASPHPVYLKTKNKNGNETEKFYVRMGNASQEISSLREIHQYIKNRFPD